MIIMKYFKTIEEYETALVDLKNSDELELTIEEIFELQELIKDWENTHYPLPFTSWEID